jgi:hypothetical protein
VVHDTDVDPVTVDLEVDHQDQQQQINNKQQLLKTVTQTNPVEIDDLRLDLIQEIDTANADEIDLVQ